MSEHFLTDIEITQFKCFSDFKATGFKRVNLIGGKNNVGKTALMEACFINVHSYDMNTFMSVIHATQFARENLNFIVQAIDDLTLLNATKHYSAKSNVGTKGFFIIGDDTARVYQLSINDWTKTLSAKELSLSLVYFDNILFIDKFGWTDMDVARFFHTMQRQGYELLLKRELKKFDARIDGLQIIDEQPYCKIHGELRSLNDLGGGLKHIISVICAICVCKDGYLFIDEIDNVIHHSQLDGFWELVLSLSKRTNCQVFATTHSLDMVEAFARVTQKLDDQAISYTVLTDESGKGIKANSRDFNQLATESGLGRAERGW